MGAAKLDRYLQDVRTRLAAEGYVDWQKPTPDFGDALVFHRRKIEFAKLSLVDSFCVVTTREYVDSAEFIRCSEAVYAFAIAGKSWAPRGFGGMVVAHAVVVTSKARPDVIETATTYVPKHWAATEYPVLVELGKRRIHHFPGTRLWGASYYRGFRDAVERQFSPS